ncbi:uncharacterized protein DUF4252 [Algoriphagus boseongensis]|uniref:Uncharacterized protein DUF4252 n=1 Tax=Algoriphagus boseongensis TaxID=1442587 RepID=A0A4R6T6T8_9BACT|nr:DUF4252 domain-containing protein [Algoriphagus boseongensis]TDQ17392.1 uncharacterized protein DUF4252 [Algoriphagus boseongensis]
MKKLVLTLTFFAMVLGVQAQSKSIAALKEKYKGNEDFFQMELGGNFMNFAEGFKIDLDDKDMATVAKSVEKLNFLTLPENSATKGEFMALQKGLQRENYDLLMEAAEGKSGFMIYSKGNRTISDLVILVGDDKDGGMMVVELKGTFTQEMVNKAKSQLN